MKKIIFWLFVLTLFSVDSSLGSKGKSFVKPREKKTGKFKFPSFLKRKKKLKPLSYPVAYDKPKKLLGREDEKIKEEKKELIKNKQENVNTAKENLDLAKRREKANKDFLKQRKKALEEVEEDIKFLEDAIKKIDEKDKPLTDKDKDAYSVYKNDLNIAIKDKEANSRMIISAQKWIKDANDDIKEAKKNIRKTQTELFIAKGIKDNELVRELEQFDLKIELDDARKEFELREKKLNAIIKEIDGLNEKIKSASPLDPIATMQANIKKKESELKNARTEFHVSRGKVLELSSRLSRFGVKSKAEVVPEAKKESVLTKGFSKKKKVAAAVGLGGLGLGGMALGSAGFAAVPLAVGTAPLAGAAPLAAAPVAIAAKELSEEELATKPEIFGEVEGEFVSSSEDEFFVWEEPEKKEVEIKGEDEEFYVPEQPVEKEERKEESIILEKEEVVEKKDVDEVEEDEDYVGI